MVVSALSGVGADTTNVLTTAAFTGRDSGRFVPLLPVTVTVVLDSCGSEVAALEFVSYSALDAVIR